MKKFTWVNTYKAISRWLYEKEGSQKELVKILKSIGVTGFKDIDINDNEFELDEIDPFSFLCYLNKYKSDSKRLEILQNLYKYLNLDSPLPEDVEGIPTTHPLKVRLFPYKKFRQGNEIKILWDLFREVVKHDIEEELFQQALTIKNIGIGKITISFFYVDPDFYIPLDSNTRNYLKELKLKYSFRTVREYLNMNAEIKNALEKKPYEISQIAWEQNRSNEYHFVSPLKNTETKHGEIKDFDGYFADEYYDSSKEKTAKIGSIRSLLDFLEKTNSDNDEVSVFYRGHSSIEFKLSPSIYRKNKLIEDEDSLFKNIIARSPFDFKECRSTFEKLVKMQHYSLPTRLLDITSNPLVALFFACKDDKNEDKDGRLYRFEIAKEEVKFFDSDAVSVVANIARRPHNFSLKGIKELEREKFNGSTQIIYLLHEIRAEKPYFEALINKEDIESVFCVRPMLDNPRIIRQEGAFFIFGISGQKGYHAPFKFDYTTLTINAKDKNKILSQLDALGISESTLFPEIEHVAQHFKEKYK